MFSGNVRRIATVVTAEDQATSTLADASSAGDETADSFEGTERSALSMKKAFAASAAVTGTLVATLGQLVRTHGETEQTFSRMQAVAGATDEEMGQIEETAARVGRELPVSMGQAAEAMEQLSFAGFDAEESMAAAEGVANIATASIMDMGESAQVTAQLLNAFDLEAENVNQVTSSLAGTFSSSALNLQELADGMQRVAPVANTVGVEVREAAAAVGVLADQGMSGRRAAGGLREVLQRITDEGDAGDTLREINLEVDDLIDNEGELRNLNEVFGTLSEGFEEAEGQAERLRLATELAGRRGARALLPLLDNTEELESKIADNMRTEIQGAIGDMHQLEESELSDISTLMGLDEDIDPTEFGPMELVEQMEALRDEGESQEDVQRRLTTAFDISEQAAEALVNDLDNAETSNEELAEAIGGSVTASEIAQSQMSTTAGAIEFLTSSYEAMTFAIFDGAGPAIEWASMRMAEFVNLLASNDDALRRFGQLLIVLTGVFGTLTAAIGAKMVAMSSFGAVLGGATASVLGTVGSLTSLSGIMGALSSAAIPAVGASLLALAKPIAIIVAVVGVLYGTFRVLQEFWEQDFMGLQSNVQDIASVFQSAFGGMVTAAEHLLPPLLTVGRVVATVLGGAIAVVVAGLVGVISELVRAGDAVWTVIDAIVPFGAIADEASVAVSLLQDGFEAMQPHLSTFAGLMGTVWDVVSPVVRVLGGLAVGLGVVTAAFIGLVNPVTLAVGAIIGAVMVLGGLWDVLTGIFDAANWRELASGAMSAIVDGFSAFIDAPVEAIWGLAASIMSLLPGSDADEGPLSGLTDAALAIPRTLAEGILSLASYPADMLRHALELMLDVHPLGDVFRMGAELIGEAASGISSRAQDVVRAVRDIFGSPRDLIDPRNWLRAGVTVITAVGEGFLDGRSAVISALDDVIPLPLDILELDTWMEAGGNVMSALGDGISSAASAPVDAISDVASSVRDRLPFSDAAAGPLSTLTDAGPEIPSAIASGITDLTDAPVSALESVLSTLVDLHPLGEFFEQGAGLMLEAAEGIRSRAEEVFRSIRDIFGSPRDLLDPSNWLQAGEVVLGAVADGMLAVQSRIIGVLDEVVPLPLDVLDVSEYVESGEALISAVTDGIEDMASAPVDAVASIASDVRDRLPFSDARTGPLSTLSDAGRAIPSVLADGVRGAARAPINAVSDIAGRITDVLPPGSTVVSSLSSLGRDAMGRLADGIRGAVSVVSNAAGRAADALISAISGALDTISGMTDRASEIGSSIGGALSDGISEAGDRVTSTASDIAGTVGDTMQSGSEAMGDMASSGRSVATTFSEGMSDATSSVTGSASDMASSTRDYMPYSDARQGPLSDITESGRALLSTFGEGVSEEQDAVVSALSGSLSTVREHLPFSDAHEGPLADLSDSGRALVQTVAGGVAESGGAVASAFTESVDVPVDELGERFPGFGGEGSAAPAVAGTTADQPVGSGEGDTTVDEGNTFDIDVNMELNVDVDNIRDTDDLQVEIRRMADELSSEALKDLERRIKQELGFNA